MLDKYHILKGSVVWILLNNVFSNFPSQTVRKWFLRLLGAKIAKKVAIYGGGEFRYPKGLVIGKGSSVGHRALLDAREGLIIGESVTLATEVMIWTLHHDYNDVNFKTVGGAVTVGNYAWLGSRCIILPGVTIGEGGVVAAGAVVTKNVLPYTVVGGVPAKVIGQRKVEKYDYMPGTPRMHFV